MLFFFAGLALGRDGGMVQNMILPFFFGLGGSLGSGQQWFPWVHVDDVAGMIQYVIENEQASGVINAVAPEAVTNKQFTQAFASALNRPAFLPVPAFVIRRLMSPERVSLMLEGQRVSPKRALELGYSFRYPDLKSACQEFAHIIGHKRLFQVQ